MRRTGRKTKYDEQQIAKAVEMYLTTDKSAEEVAQEVGLPKYVVQYHSRVARKGMMEKWPKKE